MLPFLFKDEINLVPNRAILEVIGFKNIHSEKNSFNLIRSVVYYLKNTLGKHLLIIDECGRMNHREMIYMHDLRDAVSDIAGIIFSAPDYFHLELLRDAKKNLKGIPEFLSRINSWIYVPAPSYEEKYALCQARGIINPNLIKAICKDPEYKNFRDLSSKLQELGLEAVKRVEGL